MSANRIGAGVFFSLLGLAALAGVLFLFFGGAKVAAAAAELPIETGWVTDTAGIIDDSAEAEIAARLESYKQETGTEIAVATIDSTDGEPISQYAVRLANSWGIGQRGADNGVLLLVAASDREVFVATGRQAEGGLTDLESSRIIEEWILPEFRNGDYAAGVAAGVDGIITGLDGEVFAGATANPGISSDLIEGLLGVLFFIVPWLAAILGRSKSIWPGGAIGAVAGGIGGGLASGLGFAVFAAIGLGLIGLGFDWLVSNNYQKAAAAGRKPSWWAGGSGGFGGGRSGGGFGGFSGGSFGGGGAGGRW